MRPFRVVERKFIIDLYELRKKLDRIPLWLESRPKSFYIVTGAVILIAYVYISNIYYPDVNHN